jgi:hypothetical protein
MSSKYDPVLSVQLVVEAKDQAALLASLDDRKNATCAAQRFDPINKVLERHAVLAVQLEAASTEIERLRQDSSGFIPSAADRITLVRIHDAAPPQYVGDLIRRLCARVLSVTCPAQSAECAIRKMCTNKCGELGYGR